MNEVKLKKKEIQLISSLSFPVKTFSIQEVGTKNNKTMVAFRNNTIPYKICDEVALDATVSKTIMKQEMRTKTEDRATMTRHGNCDEFVEISTPAPIIQSKREADFLFRLDCIPLFFLLF